MVEMDIIRSNNTTPHGNKYILIITDYFTTKFVDFHAIPAKIGEEVARGLQIFFLR